MAECGCFLIISLKRYPLLLLIELIRNLLCPFRLDQLMVESSVKEIFIFEVSYFIMSTGLPYYTFSLTVEALRISFDPFDLNGKICRVGVTGSEAFAFHTRVACQHFSSTYRSKHFIQICFLLKGVYCLSQNSSSI